jgi:sarcosine oxidase
MTHDVIVLGLGGMGSAAAYHLARRGQRVLGLDRHAPAHALGSSHGKSRIIREAYWEDPSYVPLVWRSYDLWAELERASGRSLLRPTGGINIGAASSALVRGALESARVHYLAHEVLDAAEIRRRFPVFVPSDDTIGVYEPRAGVLHPEACVTAHLAQAARAGAELRHDEPVVRWEATSAGVEVSTPRGRYAAGRLVVAAGPWAPVLLADLGVPMVIERQVVAWFRPIAGGEGFDAGRCPVYIWQVGGRFFYGFPRLGDEQVKIAEHEEIRRGFIARYMPAANGEVTGTSVCMYTMTPDAHFVVDHHPRYLNVVLACGFSGHGFKFAPVIGEILADLAIDGATHHDIGLFSARRFGPALTHTPDRA